MPSIIIGLLQITLFIVVARFIFGVPFTGSLVAPYLRAVVDLAAGGLGLFFSAMSMTQQQAILGAFLLMVSAILLPGFATPTDDMPEWLRPVTPLDSLRYFLVIAKGSILHNLPLTEVIANTVPLALIAIVTLSSAAWLFRRRLE